MFIKTQTPMGTKDILPKENKQYNWIKNKVRTIFERWTYQQINTPIIEFLDSLTTSLGNELVKNMLKFQDLDGELLALRPEMTIPIARCISTNYRDLIPPIRLFYIENVFRYSQSYIERKREFWQAGVELLGEPSLEAEGEILALMVNTLKRIGLQDFRIDLNDVNFLEAIFSALNIANQSKITLFKKIESKNTRDIQEFLKKESISKEISELILKLISSKKLSELITLDFTFSEELQPFIRRFKKMNEILNDYDIEQHTFFDITLSRNISYYTGLIFEVSVPESANIIGGGGRYDGLIEKFGNGDLSGSGFAIELDKCLEVLKNQSTNLSSKTETRILVIAERRIDGIIISELLRKTGCNVAFEIQNNLEQSKKEFTQKQNFDFVVSVPVKNSISLNVLNLATNSAEDVLVSDIEQLIGGV